MKLSPKIKSSADRLDYDFDFKKMGFLAQGETIQSAGTEVTPTGEVTVDSAQVFPSIVKIWLSGGENGMTYTVTLTITTDSGRVKEVCFKLRIRDC